MNIRSPRSPRPPRSHWLTLIGLWVIEFLSLFLIGVTVFLLVLTLVVAAVWAVIRFL